MRPLLIDLEVLSPGEQRDLANVLLRAAWSAAMESTRSCSSTSSSRSTRASTAMASERHSVPLKNRPTPERRGRLLRDGHRETPPWARVRRCGSAGTGGGVSEKPMVRVVRSRSRSRGCRQGPHYADTIETLGRAPVAWLRTRAWSTSPASPPLSEGRPRSRDPERPPTARPTSLAESLPQVVEASLKGLPGEGSDLGSRSPLALGRRSVVAGDEQRHGGSVELDAAYRDEW